jgi:hypothetical protein
VIILDNDRAGTSSLQLTLTARCVVGRAAPARSGWAGIRRFRAAGRGAGFEATWFDVFRGGCLTIALRPGTGVAATSRHLAGEVPVIMGYISRAELQHELFRRSGGRLCLGGGCPAAARRGQGRFYVNWIMRPAGAARR